MKNIEISLNKCKGILDEQHIPYGKVIAIISNEKLRHQFGRCNRISEPKGFTIELIDYLLDDEVDTRALENVLMHELLHTAPGCFCHTGKWKEYAQILNRIYGFKIKRAITLKELGISEDYNRKIVNHKYVCKNCGQVVTRERDRGFEKKYKCGKCGSGFVKVF